MNRQSFVLAGALLAALAMPTSALAATAQGYVCEASLDPRSGSEGTYGHVSFTLTSQPDCSGTSVGGYYLLSTGADSFFAGFRYNSTQLLYMFDQLLRASAEGTQVRFGYTGGGSGYGANQVYFRR